MQDEYSYIVKNVNGIPWKGDMQLAHVKPILINCTSNICHEGINCRKINTDILGNMQEFGPWQHYLNTFKSVGMIIVLMKTILALIHKLPFHAKYHGES